MHSFSFANNNPEAPISAVKSHENLFDGQYDDAQILKILLSDEYKLKQLLGDENKSQMILSDSMEALDKDNFQQRPFSNASKYSMAGSTVSRGSKLNYRQAMEAHLRKQQKATGMMNRKMDFFNSLLDKTNKNIEIIAHQLSEIKQN